MQIILPVIFGAAYGAVLHFLMGGRESRGAAVAPIAGAILGGLVWLILTWAGLTVDSAWIWIASLVVPAALTPVVLVVLRRTRAAADVRERARLRIS